MRSFLLRASACVISSFACLCGAQAREPGNSAYLWRQAYDAEVEKSLAAASAHLVSVNFLCAKIDFEGPDKAAKLRVLPIDFEILKKNPLPKTASVRIEGLSGSSALYRSRAADVALLAAAAYGGVKENLPDTAGLQIDFDCPESKITDYAAWMEILRNSLPEGADLSFTALPSQMDASGFKKLAGLADYFVLQIHHFAKRKGRYSIFDFDEAAAAVKRADAMGRPFLVALPTYSHVAVFDAESGELKRVYSENFPAASVAPGERFEEVRSPPREVRKLAGHIEGMGLENFDGIIYYRLPCGDERTNWSLEAFLAALSDTDLEDSTGLEAVQSGTGVFELFAVNKSSADAYAPFEFSVSGEGVAFFDALGGFEAKRSDGKIVFSAREKSFMKIPPGGRVKIGWYRKK